MYVKNLVARCRARATAAAEGAAGGWDREYAADVSMLLITILTYHTVLSHIVKQWPSADAPVREQAVIWAREWLATAGDLLDV